MMSELESLPDLRRFPFGGVTLEAKGRFSLRGLRRGSGGVCFSTIIGCVGVPLAWGCWW